MGYTGSFTSLMFLPRYVGSGNDTSQEKSCGEAGADEFVTLCDDRDADAALPRRAVTPRFESGRGRGRPRAHP
ncbi:hypothetical protein FMEAI12_3560001 [Parafrankia sp. Ea1.12]|nr:hypothetical protein FMEAI12_3560001 [Parafrankia sp. Ea1.12]